MNMRAKRCVEFLQRCPGLVGTGEDFARRLLKRPVWSAASGNVVLIESAAINDVAGVAFHELHGRVGTGF